MRNEAETTAQIVGSKALLKLAVPAMATTEPGAVKPAPPPVMVHWIEVETTGLVAELAVAVASPVMATVTSENVVLGRVATNAQFPETEPAAPLPELPTVPSELLAFAGLVTSRIAAPAPTTGTDSFLSMRILGYSFTSDCSGTCAVAER